MPAVEEEEDLLPITAHTTPHTTPPPDLPPGPATEEDPLLSLWSAPNNKRKDHHDDNTDGDRSCFCRVLVRLQQHGAEQQAAAPIIEEVDTEFLRLFRFPVAVGTAAVRGQRLSILFGAATDLNHVQTLLSAGTRPATGGEGSALINLYTANAQVLSCRVTLHTLQASNTTSGIVVREEDDDDDEEKENGPMHCLLLITPVCFWAYCKHPKLFSTLHPFSPSAPPRLRLDDGDDDRSDAAKRRQWRRRQKRLQEQKAKEKAQGQGETGEGTAL